MKKTLTIIALAIIGMAECNAQSVADLVKKQRENNKAVMGLVDIDVTKEAKKRAKALKKEGWQEPAGTAEIAKQITQGQLMGQEPMADSKGDPIKRYIMHTATVTSGSESAGYAAARAQCQREIAAMLKTKIAGVFEVKADNAQESAIDATTVDKFNERSKVIFDATLTNMIPVVHIYRVLPNYNYQVQVQIALDKKELQRVLKQQLAKQLEQEGDKLDGIVDEVLAGEFE